jgi:NAD-dependent DNA ligase
MLENATEDISVRKKQISAFFKTLEVDGMGEGNVSKLVEAGYDTICKMVHMTEKDFVSVDGFQKKMAEKLATGIRTAIQRTPLPILMAASGKFGRGMGTRKIESIFESYPNALEEHNVETLTKIKGMSKDSAEEFVKNIPDFVAFMKECNLPIASQPIVTDTIPEPNMILSEKSQELRGKTVVFSGFRNKPLENILKTLGTKMGTSVSSNTFALIVPIKTEKSTGQLTSTVALPLKSGKMKDAEELKVPMYSLEDFLQKYQITI